MTDVLPLTRLNPSEVEVRAERDRQDAKWGEQNHPDGTGESVLVLHHTTVNLDLRTGEELAAIFTRKTDENARQGNVTWRDILLEEVFEALAEGNPDRLATELVQVQAVAQQWREAIARRSATSGGSTP